MNARRGVAAFDFDGTLVPGDSLPRFLARLLGPAGLRPRTWPGGPGHARSVTTGPGATAPRRPCWPGRSPGWPSAHVAEVGEAFGGSLARRVRPEMAERLAWHVGRATGRSLVSASLALYLEPFGALTGFDEVIATRLETGPDGRLTGRMDGPNVRAHRRPSGCGSTLGPDPVELWAYGDSAGDREMLAMADHPTGVGRPALAPCGGGRRHRPRLSR